MTKATVLRINDKEFYATMLHVPALNLQDLIPLLQDKGYHVVSCRNFKDTKPYRLEVGYPSIQMDTEVDNLQGLCGKKFRVTKMPNQGVIFIMTK